MKKILTVGDSFTEGAELDNPKNDAWPTLLSEKLKHKLTNLGQGCASNDYIFRTTINELANSNYNLVIVAWTDYQRTEYGDEDGVWSTWPGRWTDWILTHSGPMYRDELAQWITKHHNKNWLFNRWITQIVTLQALLEKLNVPYMMCKAFNSNESLPGTLDKFFTKEQYMGWPNETMKDWAGDCPYGPRGHFLELGHIRVAEKIYEYIGNIGRVS